LNWAINQFGLKGGRRIFTAYGRSAAVVHNKILSAQRSTQKT